jgi:probable HAF family extracellular repeat protein
MFANKKKVRFILAALCALPLLAAAQPRYSVNMLGGAGSAAFDINLGGQVVGEYTSGADVRAFIHSDGALRDLGTLGGATASAAAINDNGQVVGVASNPAGEGHAFSYLLGVMTDLGTLGGASSRAAGLNGVGMVVGTADSPMGTLGEFGVAFLNGRSGMLGLGTLPVQDDYYRSRGAAINLHGHVVGTSAVGDFGPPEFPEHAFLYRDGAMQDLGTLGGLYSSARAINDSGLIVGMASTTLDPGNIGHTIPHAFLYVDGMMIDLGAFGDDYPGSGAMDVNNLGQVVGWDGTGSGSRAFLYEGGALQDLNLLIDPHSGWVVTVAAAINDLAQIAGTACRDGQCYAVRLDPLPADVPEPGAWLLMATGLALALTRRSRRS